MNEREFMETMAALVTAAAANENRVSETEIREAFDRMELTQEQYGMICEYLKTSRITVEAETEGAEALPGAEELFGDFDPKEEPAEEIHREAGLEGKSAKGESPEEAELFESFAGSVALLERLSKEKLKELAEGLGDLSFREEARNRLAEQFLPMIIGLAGEYGGRGVARCDLVQEGSLGVLQGLEAYVSGDLESFLEGRVRNAMEELLQEQAGQSSLGEKLTGRANRLMELSAELAEEYGREATPEELAEKLGITEEEVRDIMKISLDAMSVLEAEGGAAGDFLSNSEN